MAQLDHAVIRMKLEKLRLELEAAPGKDVDLEQRVSQLNARMKMLVEILLYLGK